MDLIPKRYSRRKRKNNMLPIDRLSDLPDSVLCHILSFLTTRRSVRTSILSRRWKSLWTDVPTLDLNGFRFNTDKKDADIIRKLLTFHKVKTLGRFHVWLTEWGDECSQPEIEACVNSAVERNAKQICVSLDYELQPPPCLFTCNAVVDLTLRCFSLSEDATACFLPALKKLYVYDLSYDSDESLERLLSGCPVLEDLTIIRCQGGFEGCCNITLPTLKRLRIKTEPSNDDDVRHTLLINAPALEYLCVYNELFEHMSAGELPSLIEADIYFEDIEAWRDNALCYHTVLEFLARLYNVKYLKLIYFEVLGSAFSSWTTKFHNLTKLELEASWRFISMFLENADNLETLIISKILVPEDMKCCAEPQKVPTCLSSHLRTIKIYFSKSAESDLEMTKYFLKNAKVLKRMEIRSIYLDKMKEKFQAMQELLLFERGSEQCVIVFD